MFILIKVKLEKTAMGTTFCWPLVAPVFPLFRCCGHIELLSLRPVQTTFAIQMWKTGELSVSWFFASMVLGCCFLSAEGFFVVSGIVVTYSFQKKQLETWNVFANCASYYLFFQCEVEWLVDGRGIGSSASTSAFQIIYMTYCIIKVKTFCIFKRRCW